MRRQTKERAKDTPQFDFFHDFNGLPEGWKEDATASYYHDDGNWSNRMILGDSLLVMASLAEREGLAGKVQCIYMDPPYGIKFNSNWQPSTKSRDVQDGKSSSVSREPEVIRAFRDTWKDGVHSYLSYLRDRLVAAHHLLHESGSIFVQIGDENVHIVRDLLDEIFGSENFVSQIGFVKTSSSTGEFLSNVVDYLLWYGKSASEGNLKFRQLYMEKVPGQAGGTNYNRIEQANGVRESLSGEGSSPSSRIYSLDNLTSQSVGRQKGEGAASWFPVKWEGEEFRPSLQVRWKTNELGMTRLGRANRIEATRTRLGYVRYLEDFPVYPLQNNWPDVGASFMADKIYVVQTVTKVIQRCLLMATDPGDLVLDPTCGSGTTAFVAESGDDVGSQSMQAE